MPTYREDIHLGHKVPLVGTDDLSNRSVTEEKMADNSVPNRALQDDAVEERNIKDRNVTAKKIAKENILPEHFNKYTVWELVKDYVNNLQNQIDSLEIAGVAVSPVFGDNEHISISQKAITMAFNRVWNKLAEITGEVLNGITLTASPSYYIGNDGCNIHVEATTSETNGFFDELKLYINDHLVADVENTGFYEEDFEIGETSVIRCEAKILGVTYSDWKTVYHHSPFFLGAGTSYTQIMDVAHTIPVTRSVVNVECSANDHIYVVIADSIASSFIRADMNGVEIAFDETSATIDGELYRVFTSQNTYQAGIYNIDVNG